MRCKLHESISKRPRRYLQDRSCWKTGEAILRRLHHVTLHGYQLMWSGSLSQTVDVLDKCDWSLQLWRYSNVILLFCEKLLHHKAQNTNSINLIIGATLRKGDNSNYKNIHHQNSQNQKLRVRAEMPGNIYYRCLFFVSQAPGSVWHEVGVPIDIIRIPFRMLVHVPVNFCM